MALIAHRVVCREWKEALLEHDQAISEIQHVLEEFIGRYGAMDTDGVVGLFADDAVVVGTGADEVRFGLGEIRTQVERDMSQADEISIVMENPRFNVTGDAAFVCADALFVGSAGGESFELPVRWTAGLTHQEDGWKFAQCHVSVAYGEQPEGESYPSQVDTNGMGPEA